MVPEFQGGRVWEGFQKGHLFIPPHSASSCSIPTVKSPSPPLRKGRSLVLPWKISEHRLCTPGQPALKQNSAYELAWCGNLGIRTHFNWLRNLNEETCRILGTTSGLQLESEKS